MLSGIRSAASTWLGKAVIMVLFGFLIFSFAIWGIGDIFRGGTVTNVATVGKSNVGIENFRRTFQQRIYDIQQRSRGFTTEQARQIGLDRQVLSQMIGEAALNEKANKLGLALSSEDVAKSLANNAAFRGSDGRFNRQAFDGYLREVGLNEAGFIQQQRQGTVRQQLTDALTSGFTSPNAMLEMLHRYRSEERTISYIVVPGAIASALPAPSDDQLKSLHEQRKAAFRAPEYRKFVAMVLSPSEFASDLQVSDSELQQAYDRGLTAGRFGTPEKRQIAQITFPNAQEAAAAADKLKGGMTWEALLEERKLKAADVDLGLKSSAELPDRTLASAAFSLAQGAVSAPVQGPFGTVLLRVTAIEAGTAQPLAAVRETLLSDVRAAKLTNDREIRRKLDAVHDKIEELRSSGKALQQVADELKRPLNAIDASDAQGRNKAGEAIAALPDQADILKAVFQSDRGVDNEPVRTRDNGYVWFEIQSIDAARERTFDEVKALVEETWRNDEAVKMSSESALGYLKRIEAGEKLEAIAQELGVNIETAEAVSRDGNDAVGPTAAATAFALGTDKFAIAGTGRGADRMILKVDSVSTPEFKADDQATRSLKSQLDTALSNEILNQYVSRVQNELGVSINDRALAQATGAQASR